MPHGAMIFDGDKTSKKKDIKQRRKNVKPEFREATERLYQGCLEAGKKVAEMEPDLIMLHSPHGIILSTSLCIYGNERASGNAEWKGQWKDIEVDVSCCTDTVDKLKSYFNSNYVAADKLRMFGGRGPNPLRWGEVIPIWFIEKALKEKKHEAKYVLLTSPRVGLPDRLDPMHMREGGVLARFIKESSMKIVMAISGDLSHLYYYGTTLDIYTPDKSSNFPDPRDEEACRMEQCIKKWVLGNETLIEDRAPPKPIPKAMPMIPRRVEPETHSSSGPIRKPPPAKKVEKKKDAGQKEKEEAANSKRKADGEESGDGGDGDDATPAKKRKRTPEERILPLSANEKWLPRYARPHLQDAARLNPECLSCGMGGFIVLHSLLTNAGKKKIISSTIHCSEAPSYYGMMAASFTVSDPPEPEPVEEKKEEEKEGKEDMEEGGKEAAKANGEAEAE